MEPFVSKQAYAVKVLLKAFASHAEAMTRRLREASEALARQTGRPIRCLASNLTHKEDMGRVIVKALISVRNVMTKTLTKSVD